MSATFNRTLIGITCLLCPLCLPAQEGDVSKGFKLLDYYTDKPGRPLKSQITGGEARPRANGVQITKGVRIENYLEDGTTNLTAIAPECYVDSKSKVASSSSRLDVETAHGQLIIEGQGFLYQQTNFDLIISNQIETTIHRELIRSTNALTHPLPFLARTNAPSGSNQLMKIFSEHFFLESSSNLAFYSGQVRVEDPQLGLTCENLTLRRSTNGSLENIVADQNVTMTNKQDQSWATGDRAVYSLELGLESVVLTGQQAHWQDREHEAKAGTFTFDRPANTLRAEQKPWMRLPRSAISQPEWFSAQPPPPTNAPPPTNQFVEITAEAMTMQLPTTNHPSRRVTALTNVVIISPADNSRATSDRAVYEDATGVAELTGHAFWRSEQRVVKGETLIFDRTNKVLSARGKAYLKMPLPSQGKPTPPSAHSQKAVPAEMLEVFSDDFIYRPAALTFHENVLANYFQGEARRGWMTCGFLSVGFNSNRIEHIQAERSVAIQQPSVATSGTRQVAQKLDCETLTVHFYTNGLLQDILARTNVLAQQDEIRPGRPQPIHSQLAAESADFFFFAHTNRVREIMAKQNVSIVQDTKKAHGEKAVYTASNTLVELTGHPTAEMPLMGRITYADALIWDQSHNTLRARATGTNVVGEGEAPRGATNQFRSFLPKAFK